jgi:hypothetical protein
LLLFDVTELHEKVTIFKAGFQQLISVTSTFCYTRPSQQQQQQRQQQQQHQHQRRLGQTIFKRFSKNICNFDSFECISFSCNKGSFINDVKV